MRHQADEKKEAMYQAMLAAQQRADQEKMIKAVVAGVGVLAALVVVGLIVRRVSS